MNSEKSKEAMRRKAAEERRRRLYRSRRRITPKAVAREVLSWILGIALGCGLGMGARYLLWDVRLVPAGQDEISLVSVSLLDDGRLYCVCRFSEERDYALKYSCDVRDGTCHVWYKRPVLPLRGKEMLDGNGFASIVDPYRYEDKCEVERVCFGRGRNAQLIWEKGMRLPHADDEGEYYASLDPAEKKHEPLYEV